MIETERAIEMVLTEGDEWQSWRALRLAGEETTPVPSIPYQDALGGFIGPTGVPSPGATGEGLCHLKLLGLGGAGAAVVAADWLLEVRTPAQAWLDDPAQVPGELDAPAGGRVWATAAAACGLLAVGRDPGARALELLRGEADSQGGFTGGAYPTFAAAGAYWQWVGAKTEMSEWALRWARQADDASWGDWEYATALTLWSAAGIPLEHPTADDFVDRLLSAFPAEGWDTDVGLTLRALEIAAYLGA